MSRRFALRSSIFAGIVIVALLLWLTFGHTSNVKVPNVVGDSQSTAQLILKSDGLTVKATFNPFSNANPPANRTVILQSPKAGSLLKKGSVVTLTIYIR